MALVLPANCLVGGTGDVYLDPSRSSVALSGSASGAALKPQGPGSLEAVYDGTLVLDVGPSEIRFVGGSRIARARPVRGSQGPRVRTVPPGELWGQGPVGRRTLSISAVAATRRILLDLVVGHRFPCSRAPLMRRVWASSLSKPIIRSSTTRLLGSPTKRTGWL